MTILNTYIPENGNIVFSPSGYQYLNSKSEDDFYYKSKYFTNKLISNQWQIDSVWENQNIYYIKNNMIYKDSFNGDNIATLTLSNPISLSIIQSTIPLKEDLQLFSNSDNGCWISDNLDQKLYRTNNLLVISDSLNFVDPSILISRIDGGCYLFDNHRRKISKISSSALYLDDIDYSKINITNSNSVRSIDVDIYNNLWVLAGNILYKINNNMKLNKTIDALSDLGASEGHVSSISIEKSSQRNDLFVCGCSSLNNWIIKYDLNGILLNYNDSLSGSCPKIIKCSQYGPSNSIYLISEEDETYIPDECASSSSDSSSSSESEGGENIVDILTFSRFVSLAEINGQPAIAYGDFSNYLLDNTLLKYARYNGSSWDKTVVASTDNSGYAPSLAEINGQPAIAYTYINESSQTQVKYTRYNGSSWQFSDIGNSNDNFLIFPSLTEDPNTNDKAIAYYENNNGLNDGLQYSELTNPIDSNCSDEDWAKSLKFVGLYPAIAYVYDTALDKKIYYTEYNGSVWNRTVIDNNFIPGGVRYNMISMEIVNGQPAIAYSSNLNLYYTRYNGSNWSSPFSIDSTVITCSLAVINNKPTIAYVNTSESLSLKYVVASDINGSSWDTPIDTGETSSINVSLANINGNIGIAFLEPAALLSKSLKYIEIES